MYFPKSPLPSFQTINFCIPVKTCLYLYTYVHSSIINNSNPSVPINGGMDRQNVIHTHNEIVFILKKEEILSHATMWMNLEYIMLIKITSHQKNTVWFHLYEVPGASIFTETEIRIMVVARVWRRGKWQLLLNGYRVSVLQTVLESRCSTMGIYLIVLNWTLKSG